MIEMGEQIKRLNTEKDMLHERIIELKSELNVRKWKKVNY